MSITINIISTRKKNRDVNRVCKKERNGERKIASNKG